MLSFRMNSCIFARALQVLGFAVALDEDNSEMKVTGLGGRIPATKAELFVGNAGTAARFLTAFLTLGTGEYILDGDARMRERPIGDLVSALSMLGAKLEASGGCPPVKIFASGLPGGKATITGDTSSQYLSALLMVLPYAKGPTEIGLSTDLSSAPYVEMTIAIMGDFGVSIRRVDDNEFRSTPRFLQASGCSLRHRVGRFCGILFLRCLCDLRRSSQSNAYLAQIKTRGYRFPGYPPKNGLRDH